VKQRLKGAEKTVTETNNEIELKFDT